MSTIDEIALTERLIGFDTSRPEGIRDAVAFIGGWIEANGIQHQEVELDGRPSVIATAGEGDRTIVWSSHVDVVPGEPAQFTARQRAGRLYGRGSYDMKGALAAMLAALADFTAAPERAPGVRAQLLIVPDEESEARSHDHKATARLADAGYVGEFVVCGEPTDLNVGIQAKGALVLRLDVHGRSAHGSTPWLGENAVLKAVEIATRVALSCRSPRPVAALHRRPDRESGPHQWRRRGQPRARPLQRRPGYPVPAGAGSRRDPRPGSWPRRRGGAHLSGGRGRSQPHERATSPRCCGRWPSCDRPSEPVGRDGASDAAVFLNRGVPSAEFGPVGAGHHGPDEYVEVASLGVYRRALGEFLSQASAIGAG